jgi:hypothetical protein
MSVSQKQQKAGFVKRPPRGLSGPLGNHSAIGPTIQQMQIEPIPLADANAILANGHYLGPVQNADFCLSIADRSAVAVFRAPTSPSWGRAVTRPLELSRLYRTPSFAGEPHVDRKGRTRPPAGSYRNSSPVRSAGSGKRRPKSQSCWRTPMKPFLTVLCRSAFTMVRSIASAILNSSATRSRCRIGSISSTAPATRPNRREPVTGPAALPRSASWRRHGTRCRPHRNSYGHIRWR